MQRKKVRIKWKAIAKLIVFVLAIVALAFFAIPETMKSMKEKNNNEATIQEETGKTTTSPLETTDTQTNTSQTVPKEDNSTADSITASQNKTLEWDVDNWSGWFALVVANGGLSTTADSYIGLNNVSMNINVINSDSEKLERLISGKSDATACTINRLSLISGQLAASNTDVVVPYLTDYSNGGDGIVARKNLTSIESLKDVAIGVGEDSVSHCAIVWLIQQSDRLTEDDKLQMIANIKTYSSAYDATQAYLNGEIDALGTWEPYLSEAANSGDSHILFSTKTSSSLISDAFIVRKDYIENNPEVISKVIDGALAVVEDLKNGKNKEKYCEIFRNSLPDFADCSDDEIMQMLSESVLMDYHQNVDAFNNSASSIFTDMCSVWEAIGKETFPEMGDSLFDSSYLLSLADKYESTSKTESSSVAVTDSNREQVIETDALLTKTTTVNFQPQTSKFMDDSVAEKELDEFVRIAKILNGSIIQIEGNVSSRNTTNDQLILSENRAIAVKNYLVSKGIEENRIITIGNGGYKPIFPDPKKPDEYTQNRRVDLFFKIVEEY